MRILLLGKSGQLGWELQRALAPLGELIALDRHGSENLCGDLSRPDALAATVRQLAPEVIVNAAAYTAVDKAESEVELAMRINAEAPAVLAAEAVALGALLVHYSTDYVFDGSGQRRWHEADIPAPVSVYGESKWQGERAIRASGCKQLIFRTSWVYGRRGGNFIRTMLRLAAERSELKVIDDQIGAPTSAELIADVSAHALRATVRDPALCGVYHLCAGGETSWHGYASFVIDHARRAGSELKAGSIVPIPTANYPTPAQRPLNSRLDTQRLRQSFQLSLPNWRDGVARVLSEIL